MHPALSNGLAVALAGAAFAFAACTGGGDGDRGAQRPPTGTAATPAERPTEDGTAGVGDVSAASTAALPPIEQLEVTARDVFASYFDRKDDADRRFYADGVWHGPSGCWPCATGPAGLGAVLWSLGKLPDAAHRAAVVETFDHAIAARQQANGSYGKETNSEAINVAFFAPVLGSALLVLGDRIPAASRERWRRSLLRSARFLRNNKELQWYVNGNINLAYALTLYVTWRATGDRSIRSLYRRQLDFVEHPPGRWSEHGLELRRRPARSDGADGRGYLAESGPGGTGYDPEYTQLTLDVLSRLYVMSGDREILRLTNLLTNQTLPGVDERWNLLTTGTRHPEPDRYVPYTTPALTVLGRLGGRKDLAPRVDEHIARIAATYRSAMTFSHPNFYRGTDSQMGTALLALNMRRPGDRAVLAGARR